MNSQRCNQCTNCLVIDSQQVHIYGAATLMLACCIFVAGYFFGKKVATENFKEEIEQQLFADQIQHSLHMLYNAASPAEQDQQQRAAENISVVDNDQQREELAAVPEKAYYARLITYHSPVHAQKFVERLRKKGINASLVKKVSTAQNGKTVRRYQVVTAPYMNKEEIEKVVEMLKKSERLAHVAIELYSAPAPQKGNS